MVSAEEESGTSGRDFLLLVITVKEK